MSEGPPARARLDVAWTASCNGVRGGSGFASAALRFGAIWDQAPGKSPAACEAFIDRAGTVTPVRIGASLHAEVRRRGRWTHIRISGADDEEVLSASFETGRLSHCRSSVPAAAGLPGGSYEAPTAILELYEMAAAEGQRRGRTDG